MDHEEKDRIVRTLGGAMAKVDNLKAIVVAWVEEDGSVVTDSVGGIGFRIAAAEVLNNRVWTKLETVDYQD